MSDSAAAAPKPDSTPASPAPAKTPVKKATKPRTAAKPADHPKYVAMVAAAVSSLKERGGSSRQAILKYIMANYKVGDEVTKINARIKTALKSGVTDGTLKQAKGTGATGSFRLVDKKKVAADKPKPKKVMKPKTAVTKKPKSPKKVAVKKPRTPTKKAAAAKPKKVKTPKKVAAAKPKKAKSPAKKAAKPKAAKPKTAKPKTAKPNTPKKAAAKKPAAKAAKQ